MEKEKCVVIGENLIIDGKLIPENGTLSDDLWMIIKAKNWMN